MSNRGYIDFPQKIKGLTGQWLYAINTDPKRLVKFLSELDFDVYIIEGSLVTDDESLFHQVEKAIHFDPFHHPITNWGMWDEYWSEFVINSKSSRTAIVLQDSDVFYERNTQLFLRSLYDIFSIILGLERRSHDQEIDYQAVLFVHGKTNGYKRIESTKFLS
jgi:hypothetical protein